MSYKLTDILFWSCSLFWFRPLWRTLIPVRVLSSPTLFLLCNLLLLLLQIVWVKWKVWKDLKSSSWSTVVLLIPHSMVGKILESKLQSFCNFKNLLLVVFGFVLCNDKMNDSFLPSCFCLMFFYLNSDLPVFQVRDIDVRNLVSSSLRSLLEVLKQLPKYKWHNCTIHFFNGRLKTSVAFAVNTLCNSFSLKLCSLCTRCFLGSDMLLKMNMLF